MNKQKQKHRWPSMTMTMSRMTVTMTLMTMTLITWLQTTWSIQGGAPQGSRCSMILWEIIRRIRSVHFVSLGLVHNGRGPPGGPRCQGKGGGEGGAGQQVVGRGPRPVVLEYLHSQLGHKVRESVVHMGQHHLFISIPSYSHLHRSSLQKKIPVLLNFIENRKNITLEMHTPH